MSTFVFCFAFLFVTLLIQSMSLCVVDCSFFKTVRDDCQRDPCLAVGSACFHSNETAISSSCNDWCCVDDSAKLLTTTVGASVGFLIFLCLFCIAFRKYAMWKTKRDNLTAEAESGGDDPYAHKKATRSVCPQAEV